jgi:hypothetical protein
MATCVVCVANSRQDVATEVQRYAAPTPDTAASQRLRAGTARILWIPKRPSSPIGQSPTGSSGP